MSKKKFQKSISTEPEFLSAREAAERLSIHINTLKRISPTLLPYYRIVARGDRRYRIGDIANYLMNCQVTR